MHMYELSSMLETAPVSPLTYFNDGGEGGGGVEVIFLGAETLAKSDVLGLPKTPGFFEVVIFWL